MSGGRLLFLFVFVHFLCVLFLCAFLLLVCSVFVCITFLCLSFVDQALLSFLSLESGMWPAICDLY